MSKIEFKLEETTFIIVKIVDIMGNVVGTLLKEKKAAGIHFIDFNEDNFMPGRYYYKIYAKEKTGVNGSAVECERLLKTDKIHILKDIS